MKRKSIALKIFYFIILFVMLQGEMNAIEEYTYTKSMEKYSDKNTESSPVWDIFCLINEI